MMGNVNPKAKCEKIEGGYRIEITGIDIKGESSHCCIPVVINCCDDDADCCPRGEKKE